MEYKTKNGKGVVYILTNPSFPDYVKIGYADNLGNRLQQLNNSECIPFAFRAYATLEVDKRLADKEVHKLFDTLNPELRSVDNLNGKMRRREFFQIDAESAYQILLLMAGLFSSDDRVKKIIPTEDEKEEEKVASVTRQRNALRTEFWNEFADYYKSRDDLFKGVNIANSTTWCSKRVKGNDYIFWVTLNSVSVRLNLNKDIFNKLYAIKKEIETKLSILINWDIDKREVRIENTNLRITQSETWQSIFEFMTRTMVIMKEWINFVENNKKRE